jgi:hypothetical protein
MKNKKGFIATSLIYSFFLIFLTLMVSVLTEYVHNRILLSSVKETIVEKLNTLADFYPVFLENTTYNVGDTIDYLGEEWEVVEDYGASVKLILKRSLTSSEISASTTYYSGATTLMCANSSTNDFCYYVSSDIDNFNTYYWDESIPHKVINNWFSNDSLLQKAMDYDSLVSMSYTDGLAEYEDYIRIPVYGEVSDSSIWYLTHDSTSDGVSKIKNQNSSDVAHSTYKKIRPIITAKKYNYKNSKDITDVITIANSSDSSGETSTTTTVTYKLFYDDTTDKNLRFIGANPNNYIKFYNDNRLWRVIGVMNNIETESGDKKSLIKIITADSIGNIKWSSSGINDWSTSSMQTYLNGTWYETNLITHSEYIENVVWNLGGSSTNNITAKEFYNAERSNLTGGSNTYPSTFVGKVGLMYPSDYGYAAGNSCLSYNLSQYSSYSECKNGNYLPSSSVYYTWTMTSHVTANNNSSFIFFDGNILQNYDVTNSYYTFPVVYLKTDSRIIDGNGTKSNPWVIGK